MPLPGNDTICLDCQTPPQALCASLPGGAQLCVNLPNAVIPSPSEVARQFFAQLNAALTPLTPIFNILDAVTAVFNCVQAIPDAITKLDVGELLKCAPDMFEKVQKLTTIFPPLSIPVMVKDALTAIIAFLSGLRDDLDGAQRQLNRIAAANLLAQQPGNANLLAAISCAQNTYDRWMEHMQGSAEPLNRLMGILNMFLSLVPGVDPLPCLGLGGGNVTALQDALEDFIQVLTIVRNLLPGGLKLNPYVPKGANCT